ncbi:MAG: hypothetical protein KDB30_07990, partial [Tetrasphaera sp.]|nr:hypothetical protein [Tetrasphaera sp.]
MRAGAFFAVAFFDTVLFFDTVVFFDAGVFDDGVFDAVLFRADGVRWAAGAVLAVALRGARGADGAG